MTKTNVVSQRVPVSESGERHWLQAVLWNVVSWVRQEILFWSHCQSDTNSLSKIICWVIVNAVYCGMVRMQWKQSDGIKVKNGVSTKVPMSVTQFLRVPKMNGALGNENNSGLWIKHCVRTHLRNNKTNFICHAVTTSCARTCGRKNSVPSEISKTFSKQHAQVGPVWYKIDIYWVKIPLTEFRIKQNRLTHERQECDLEITSEKGQFRFWRIRFRRDPPVFFAWTVGGWLQIWKTSVCLMAGQETNVTKKDE